PATFTLVPTETPTQTPTPSVTPTPSRTPTITPTSVIDRACPEFYFPIYNRNWLAADKWPSPNPNPETHLWFTRPLAPIGDRFLINTNFPYGFDGGVQGALLLHNGVDVSQDYGTPLLAVADGVVVYAGADLEARYGWRCDWYGKFVVILHDDEWLGEPVYSLYGHVQNIIVEPGQRVFRAEQVAEVGSGGAAKVNHLHFEIRVGENDFFNSRNPLLWIAPASGRGVLAGRIVDPRGRPWQGISLILEPNDPNLKRYQTWSYLGDPDNVAIPDEHLAENFVIGDMKAGSYTLHTIVQGANYRQDIFIEPGQINTVEIVTGPFRTPTPSPP
ncbi:MAG: M23 family metallopeptidase, partial [Candidatus Promineifilaceae bacterium]